MNGLIPVVAICSMAIVFVLWAILDELTKILEELRELRKNRAGE